MPLRSYGFKFLLNADWIVPSSREDITQDNVWNEWLREELPALYTDALVHLRQLFADDEGDGLEDVVDVAWSVLRYLPLEGEVLGWFRQTSNKIVQQMRLSECMLTAQNKWVLPGEVCVAGRAGGNEGQGRA